MIEFDKIQDDNKMDVMTRTLLQDECAKVFDELCQRYNMKIVNGKRTTFWHSKSKSDNPGELFVVNELIITRLTGQMVNDVFEKLSKFLPLLAIDKLTFTEIQELSSISHIHNLPEHVENFTLEGCDIKNLKGFPQSETVQIIACNNLLQNTPFNNNASTIVVANCGGIDFDPKKCSLPNIKTFTLARSFNCKHLPKLNNDCTLVIDVQTFPKLVDNQLVDGVVIYNGYNRTLEGCPRTNRLCIIDNDHTNPNTWTSFEGIPDEVVELCVDSAIEFPIENNLPKNLEILKMNGYYMRNKGITYNPGDYEWPSSLREIHLGTDVSEKYRKILKVRFAGSDIEVKTMKAPTYGVRVRTFF